jgi:hypothetical protein
LIAAGLDVLTISRRDRARLPRDHTERLLPHVQQHRRARRRDHGGDLRKRSEYRLGTSGGNPVVMSLGHTAKWLILLVATTDVICSASRCGPRISPRSLARTSSHRRCSRTFPSPPRNEPAAGQALSFGTALADRGEPAADPSSHSLSPSEPFRF